MKQATKAQGTLGAAYQAQYMKLDESQIEELQELIAAQDKDVKLDKQDKAKGEYLGGNGVSEWHQCKADENVSVRSTMSDELVELMQDYTPEAIEHSGFWDTIEHNANYIVRFTAAWRSGFDGDKFSKREARLMKSKADHGYKFDRRKNVNQLCADERAAKREAEKQAYMERKAKRLAKLAARYNR